MNYFWTGLVVAYMLFSWYQLKMLSSQVRPCSPQSSSCFQPLVVAGDPLVMELWLYQPVNEAQNNETASVEPSSAEKLRFAWSRVETCTFNISVPASGALPIDLTGTSTDSNNCTVPLPKHARERSKSQPLKPLKAKFRFRFPDSASAAPPVADVPFELTRIVERKDGLLSSITQTVGVGSTSSSSSKSKRNLLQDRISSDDVSATKNNDMTKDDARWIPYLKYGRSAIRIRVIDEDRSYGDILQRKDGLRLRPWNRTHYKPMIYVDDHSLQRSSQIELAPAEDNKPPVSLSIKLGGISPHIDSLNQQVGLVLEMAEQAMPGPELDEFRYFLQDEKLYRFALTQVISYVHLWFDYMAFRDEIRFYKGRQNLSGVSASSVISRFLCSFIIFLYLLDGGGTSWLVLFSLGSSSSVEAWKVWKLLRPTLKTSFPFVSVRQLSTSKEIETAEYDRIASTNLALALYPLVIGSSIYSLHHYNYSGWYSWFISSAADAVYTFGFIALCPQLYVNYRLKSVAHLPWKVFMYKIFNTFVDDAFAFIIDMPMKHRLMTLRDDVVFLLFLVQVYLYRVDKSRTNEYGYSYAEEDGDQNEFMEDLSEAFDDAAIEGRSPEMPINLMSPVSDKRPKNSTATSEHVKVD